LGWRLRRDAKLKEERDLVDTLDTYLKGDYQRDEAEVTRLIVLMDSVVDTLLKARDGTSGYWPYKWSDGGKSPGSQSQSTTAMIGYALHSFRGGRRCAPLAPGVAIRHRRTGATDPEIAARRSKAVGAAVEHALGVLLKAAQGPNGIATNSKTYGTNDPFTLTWLFGFGPRTLGANWQAVAQACRSRVHEGFEGFGKLHTVLPLEPTLGETADTPHEVAHSFQVTRLVHLREALMDPTEAESLGNWADAPTPKQVDEVRQWLLSRVHLHLSLAASPGSSFDPADMTLALEGFSLLSGSTDIRLMRQVMAVLGTRQDMSEYWRPLLPFKATDQGAVLLPQSVEVAHALLRIFDHAYGFAPELFSQNLPLVRRYVLWLESRAHYLPDAQGVGWESEHTYLGDEIHLWATSQVLSFLGSYVALLQRHMADVALLAAGLVDEPASLPGKPTKPNGVIRPGISGDSGPWNQAAVGTSGRRA
jgi:hypothetical protein